MKLRTGVIVSLLTIAMLASVLQPVARAFIPEPYELYGVARDSSNVVLSNGEPIRSFIDGVDYSNKTSVFSRPAQTDGYFDIDTFGNQKTNATDPGTPTVKEGGDDGEPIMYVWGDMSDDTGKGVVFEEPAVWQTGIPPQAGNLNAALPAEQPPLIKIFSIVTQSQLSTQTDYVWLCNPTTSVVDASQFYIQKDLPSNMNGPTVTIAGSIPANGGKLFVDLLSTTYFVTTGDNVKLVWTNAGTAFGGNDIIVDRVEFNASVGGTLYWEPGNTIQGDEIAPGPGGSINRNVACADTNSRVQDFSPDVENRQNNPPLAPDPICLQGLCGPSNQLSHITVLTNFPITWTHIDPDGDPQTQAQPSVYAGASLVWGTTVSGTTSTATFTGVLLACNDYELRVRTKDAFAYGPESILPFHTNCPPTGLNNRAPSNGATLAAKSNQLIWWSVVADLDAMDTHNYTYMIAEDLAFTVGVITQTTANNYSAPFTTQPSKQYFWKVNVSDGWGSQPYTSPYQFTTGAGATDPTVSAPTVDGYASGNAALTHLTNHVPVFGWTYAPGTGTQTAYHIVVENTTTSSIIWDQNTTGTAASIAYGGGWALLDGGDYRFYVKVADSNSPAHWSAFSAWVSFHINTPPPVPVPSAPAGGSSITASTTQTVAWASGGTDAESDAVTYTYCVGTATPPYTACGTATGTGITGTTSNAFTTTAGTRYYWAIKASDSFEESAWSAIWDFNATSVSVNNPPSIVLTNLAATVDKNTQQTIQWTMSDDITPSASLVVFLNYSIGGGAATLIARVVGVTSYVWSVPDAAANNVVINATVIDGGGLKGWDTTAPFNIVAPSGGGTTPTDNTVLYIAIIIIIVVVVLVLLLLMKRKKPKEEEEEAPAEEKAEEEAPAEEELTEEEAPKAAPAAAAKPGAKPSGKTKECPGCGTIVSATDKECFMCGAKL